MYTLIRKNFLLILIIILATFIRFYKLSDFPIQLNHDEVSQLYDAISISQTGRDIYGNFMPYIFISVNDFKPPAYTYMTSIFYFLFGWREIIIKLPGAIFGILMVPAVFMFVKQLLKSKKIALWSAFLTAVAPFEIFFSRKSFENGAGIVLILIGFSFVFKFFESKNMKLFYASVLIFALGMYTYFSHAIIIPFLLIIFAVIFRSKFSNKFVKYLPALILFLLTISPIFLMITFSGDVSFRAKTVFISQDPQLGKLYSYIQSPFGLFDSLLKFKTLIDYSFNRYLQQFSLPYIFQYGLDFTNRSIIGMGLLYYIQLPFVILGFIYLLRKKNLSSEKKFIFVWILLGMLPSGLTFESNSPHRSIMVFTMLNIISAVGLSGMCDFFQEKHKKVYFKYAISVLVIIFFGNFIYFFHMYFVNFSYEKSQFLQYPYKQIAQFAWSQYGNYNSIIFDPQFGDAYPMGGVGVHYYLAYYGNYPPAKFQYEYRTRNQTKGINFDKFSIRSVFWPEDKNLKGTLVIVSPWSVPKKDLEGYKIVKEFNFYNGKLAYYAIKL